MTRNQRKPAPRPEFLIGFGIAMIFSICVGIQHKIIFADFCDPADNWTLCR